MFPCEHLEFLGHPVLAKRGLSMVRTRPVPLHMYLQNISLLSAPVYKVSKLDIAFELRDSLVLNLTSLPQL